ncbi:hypothetical protein ACFVXC_23240 [Streptomyces sp. NPDC058257]|uniref:hypothetical protein n=1 Tax=Streptomyces sp. NPDC058257 TaxID=3346409 RepID=UPI0036E89F30
MSNQPWTTEELADLDETIATARESSNTELADYWQGIRDGKTPTVDWEDLRIDLYAQHGIDVSGNAA